MHVVVTTTGGEVVERTFLRRMRETAWGRRRDGGIEDDTHNKYTMVCIGDGERAEAIEKIFLGPKRRQGATLCCSEKSWRAQHTLPHWPLQVRTSNLVRCRCEPMRYEGKVGGSSRVPTTVPMLYHPIPYTGMLGTSYISYVILPLPSSSCMCMPSHRNTMCAVSLPLPARDAFLTSYCDGATSYVYGRRTRACRTVYYSIGRDLPTSQALYLLQ